MKNGSLPNYIECEDQSWRIIREEMIKIPPSEEERIMAIISLVPESCSSILDAGCGNGEIANRLILQHKKVYGLDVSKESLQDVKSNKILGTLESLPFPDRCFDLVICSEVLEHVHFNVYKESLKEIERVAAKYIIISVPNNENIKENFITCPDCGCNFHPSRHLRSFNLASVKDLFCQFITKSTSLCRPLVRSYPRILLKGARFLGFIKKHFHYYSICPQCGYFVSPEHRVITNNQVNGNLKTLCFRLLKSCRKHKGWIIVLYERLTDGL